MEAQSKDNKLYGLLEKIIFNEDEFMILKATINEVSTGKKSPKTLREQIVQDRIRILEDLLQFFPFYEKYSAQQKSKEQPEINQKKEQELIRKIEEREELLGIIAKRLQRLGAYFMQATLEKETKPQFNKDKN
ncbi:MAG: hypothetical protein ACFE8J_19380 [Candidatus Heimdallarchaeota archaeon]